MIVSPRHPACVSRRSAPSSSTVGCVCAQPRNRPAESRNRRAPPAPPIRKKMERLRIKLRTLNSHIICKICAGYLIDATTVTECLHTCTYSIVLRAFPSGLFAPVGSVGCLIFPPPSFAYLQALLGYLKLFIAIGGLLRYCIICCGTRAFHDRHA